MLPQMKSVIAIIPISKTDAATAVTDLAIDTMGYDWCHIVVSASTADVVSNTLSVLKLTEGDTTVISNMTDIADALGGTAFTIATNAYTTTTNSNIWSFNVDLRARKRYLAVTASPQTTMVMQATAVLGRGEQAPITAAKAGVLNLVEL